MSATCKACGKPRRKGASRRATILFRNGTIEAGYICRACAIRAVLLVAEPPVTVAPACAECGHELAAVGRTCFDRASRECTELRNANLQLYACINRLGGGGAT